MPFLIPGSFPALHIWLKSFQDLPQLFRPLIRNFDLYHATPFLLIGAVGKAARSVIIPNVRYIRSFWKTL
nr:MAG TPA: hypothetical protein [Caudoviricetes sp.]